MQRRASATGSSTGSVIRAASKSIASTAVSRARIVRSPYRVPRERATTMEIWLGR
ncbi:hypothetical protein [Streptomyces sp. SP18CS02]|uniref:hypothetical protein n=1 Tax=Streptomyces sp. SP18CS02 TaxID=3002531 RepID=UPI002E76A994|nr:hypothetical protein [Streptomyces sp. SP18CS02]MEE1753098.1 hypothetical protein [Streptomyces sp. SP18CS02]